MSSGYNFEDLENWQKGVRLSAQIYPMLKECKDYAPCTLNPFSL